MPFLLLDDAADQVKQRLSDFGQQQLQGLQSTAGSVGSAVAEAPASAQDITQRLMSFGQDQLSQALAAQQQQAAQGAQQLQSFGGDLASSAQQAGSGVADITGRLRDYGQQVLSDASANVQQGVQQLTPLNQPSQQGSITPFGDNQPAGGAIDSSSPDAFARSVAPYAQAAAQQLGVDPKWVVAMMGSESNYGKAPGNELFGVKGSGTAGSQTLRTHEGEYGGYQTDQGFAAYNTPQEAVSAWVNLIKNHYPGAVGAPDLATFVHGLKSGGYFTAAEDEYRNILQSITNNVGPAVDSALGGATRAVNQATSAVQTGARDLAQSGQQGLSNLSQFGDKELTAAQAYAACGPAAAVRFAQLFGRNPTMSEAISLASQVGWTAASGMAGLGSESKLFDAMQIPHRQVGADWAALQREASSGNPVVISTPGHYFTADAYDPTRGFHVGASGTDLRAGSEWMTPQQIEGVMGGLQGGLVVDHPLIGNSSVIAGGLTTAGNALKAGGQAAQRGLQALDGAIQDIGPQALDLASGGITRRFNEQLSNLGQTVTGGPDNYSALEQGIKPLTSAAANALDTTAGTAESLGSAGPVSPELMRTAASFLRQPGILDSLQITQQLEAKYGTRDTSQYSPEDQQAYNQALLTVGGVLGSLNAEPVSGGSTRMYHGTSGAFDRPDPSRFQENGLYGPGYYLTSNADIAGGVVAGGGEQVGPSWLRSSVKRAPGEVISPGYAQATPRTDISSLQADLADVTTRLSDPTISDRMRAMLEGRQVDLQRQVDAATPSSGPNVRAIDLPPVDNEPKELQPLGQAPTQSDKLHLFDMEAPLSPAARANVMDVLETDGDPYWVRDLVDRSSSGQDVYDALARQGSRYATDTLQAAGFDGITHSGGARIPMSDASGRPIQHDVAVVFPDSLDKLRNATSGRLGGEAAAPFALGLGGAAALGLGAKEAWDNRDQLGELKDRALSSLEDFRQSQAAGDTRDFSFTAPLTAGLSAAKDALEQQRQDQTTGLGQATQDYLDAIRNRDPQAILQTAADLAQRTAGMGQGGGDADVSSSLSSGLTAAGVDPDVSRALGMAGNFVAPVLLEGALGRGGPMLARAAASDLARGESGALRLPGGGGILDQDTLSRIRERGIPGRAPPAPPPGSPQRIQWLTGTGPWAPPPPRPVRGPIAQASDATKQFMLSGPGGMLGNIISNTGELLRSPVGLTLGGRGADAIAGSAAVGQGLPDAVRGALKIFSGEGAGNLSQEAIKGKWYEPIYKVLSASDQFTRTLAEYQRMAEEGSAMLRRAGIDPSDPAAESYLNSHAAELQEAGRKGGANSVFAMADTTAGGRNFLDRFFDGLNRWKNGKLDSPSLRDQALGAMLDFQVPFLGVPVRMLNLLANRLPGTAQATGAYRAVKAMNAGNVPEMQRQIGNTVMETALQLLIAENIREGNIRGPNDPEHPNSAKILGHWVNLNEFGGGYTLPMQIMAAFAEGAEKGYYQPASDRWNRMGNQLGSALTSSLKPLTQAIPGENMIHFLGALGEGPGAALNRQVSDTLGRIAAPAAGKFLEDTLDPVQRDVSRQFPQAWWESTQAKIPGLAELLPEKIDMTTGQPLEKRSSGFPGALLREQTGEPSDLTVELKKLNTRGYPIDAPSDYPDSVTVGNSKISLKPNEQRAVAKILGGTTSDLAAAFIKDPSYQQLDDATKVRILQRYLAAADRQRTSAALQVIPPNELNDRILAGERDIGGRALSSGANLIDEMPFLSSSSLSADEQRKALSR